VKRDPEALIAAARVPESLAEQEHGIWAIRRRWTEPWEASWSDCLRFTALTRWTETTLHSAWGEVVMEDTPRELRRHLPIWMSARGRVLVTGLGLGCVVRGLLACREVEHVDVVELDPWIASTVGREFAADTRVSIIVADALDDGWRPAGVRWQFAWHDLWLEEGSLAFLHLRLIASLHHRVDVQGAWGWPMEIRRLMPREVIGLGLPRRRVARPGVSA
jgi:hypothetical protein